MGAAGESGSRGARDADRGGGEAVECGAERVPHGKQRGGECSFGQANRVRGAGGRGGEAAGACKPEAERREGLQIRREGYEADRFPDKGKCAGAVWDCSTATN